MFSSFLVAKSSHYSVRLVDPQNEYISFEVPLSLLPEDHNGFVRVRFEQDSTSSTLDDRIAILQNSIAALFKV